MRKTLLIPIYHYNFRLGSNLIPTQFRWNILLNVILWVLLPLPAWMPLLHPHIPIMWSITFLFSIQAMFTICWLAVAFMSLITYFKIFLSRHQIVAEDKYTHLVCMATYKEPIELLVATIESLANQTVVGNTILAIGFEERTPDKDVKEDKIRHLFGSVFKKIIITAHPYGVEGEIPGKCSNNNFALRESEKNLRSEGYDTDNILVTTCDADNKFHPNYLETLGEKFSSTPDPHTALYQAPLLYNWGLDEASIVTRVTGIVRASLMMGVLIPFNINTMSVFSFSGKLMKQGKFVHPGYQMDDIICLIRFMGITRERLRIICVPVFNLSGPTSGRVIEDEIVEWARQARRWTIGAGEVFHYFMIKSSGIPCLTGMSWGICFLFYYCILLCGSSLYSFILGMSTLLLPFPTSFPVSPYLSLISLSFLLLTYLTYAIFFFIDWKAPLLLEPKPVEKVCFLRNFYHFLLSPLVLLAYSLVELYALHELLFLGKEVCKHGASKKQTLGV